MRYETVSTVERDVKSTMQQIEWKLSFSREFISHTDLISAVLWLKESTQGLEWATYYPTLVDFFFCPRSKFKDSVEQECSNPDLEGRIQLGFPTNQADIFFPLALVKAVLCQGRAQKPPKL